MKIQSWWLDPASKIDISNQASVKFITAERKKKMKLSSLKKSRFVSKLVPGSGEQDSNHNRFYFIQAKQNWLKY